LSRAAAVCPGRHESSAGGRSLGSRNSPAACLNVPHEDPACGDLGLAFPVHVYGSGVWGADAVV